MNPFPEELKSKSFWNKPEGTTGMIVIALMGLGGVFILPGVLTFILGLLTLGTAVIGQAISLALLCIFLGIILYIITNKKFLTLSKYIFKSVIRKLTSVFVEIDPIGIMRGYIDSLKEKKEVFNDKKSELSGQIRRCKETISKNEKEINNAMSRAKVAKDQGNASLVAVNSRNAGRLGEFNKTLGITLSKMDMLYTALNKYAEATDAVIEDLTNEVKVREQEREMMLSSYGAMRAVMSIMSGNGDERELYDQAMDFVVEDYGKKVGEIEDFMNMSKTTIEGIDLQNGVWEQQALEKLAAWESKPNSLLLGDDKRLLVEDKSENIINLKQGDDYAELFNKGQIINRRV